MNPSSRTILLVEDNPGDARLIREMLSEEADHVFRLERSESLASGLTRLAAGGVDVVVLDLSLPDSTGLDTFRRVHAQATGVPIVVLTGLSDAAVGVATVQLGAQDYLVKGQVDGPLLVRALHHAIERSKLYWEAQNAVRLRDSVLTSVSHDLRGPLTPIRLIADTLRWQIEQANFPDAQPMLDGLSRIETNVMKMSAQIDEIIDVAHLQMGAPLRLHYARVDLVGLLSDTVADYQARTTRQRIQLDAGDASVIGRWDRARLERVFGNLLSNAIKYSSAGSAIVVEMEQLAEGSRDWVVVRVRDQGLGIPAADLAKLFSWYHRGANVVGQIAGSGIGLAGARHIVDMHGGSISVESQEGIGSTFVVHLPLEPFVPDLE